MNPGPDAGTRLEERLASAPTDFGAWLELAALRNSEHRAHEALAAANCALTLDPSSLPARYQLGIAQLELNCAEDAAGCFTGILAVQPLSPEVLVSLGTAYCHLRRYDEAALVWEQAARVSPTPVEVLEELALCHQRRGDLEKVAETWHRVAELDPRHPSARHHLAALGFGEVPLRAANDYVVKLFDEFAHDFDYTLKALDYEGPARLAEMVATHGGSAPRGLRILDAGCGTGLCAPFLRPWAERLEGVDLSPKMLEKAAERELYDVLHHDEMTRFLKSRISAYDLIVAADSVNYFGSLDEWGSVMGDSLREGGRCAFFVERIDEAAAPDFRLEAHGRYSHQPWYVLRCLEAAGLEVAVSTEAPVRKEHGRSVIAAMFLAVKP